MHVFQRINRTAARTSGTLILYLFCAVLFNIDGANSDTSYSQLLKICFNSYQNVKASWLVNQELSQCQDSEVSYLSQKKLLDESFASGQISKRDYEAALSTARYITDQKVISNHFTIDLTLINATTFKVKQAFLDKGSSSYEYYASGNGLCFSVGEREKSVTITKDTQLLLGDLIKGNPINVSNLLLEKNTIPLEKVQDTPESITLRIKAGEGSITLVLLKPKLTITSLTLSSRNQVRVRMTAEGEVSCGQLTLPKVVNYESFCQSGKSKVKQTWTLQDFSAIPNPTSIDTGYSLLPGYSINDWSTEELHKYRSDDVLGPGKGITPPK